MQNIRKDHYALLAALLSFGASSLQPLSADVATEIAQPTQHDLFDAANKAFIKKHFTIGITESGKSFFWDLAAAATTDIEILKKRQALIKAFLEEPELLKKIIETLQIISSLEREMSTQTDITSSTETEKNSESMPELRVKVAHLKQLIDSSTRLKNTCKNEILSLKEIDAFASMALSMSTTENPLDKKLHYCFAEFVENSNSSILKAENLWGTTNYLTKATPRKSIKIGTDAEHPRAVISTMKSLYEAHDRFLLSTLPANIILAQAFGVARADSFRFTPFAKIISHIPLDNTKTASCPQREAKAIQSTIDYISTLKPTEHAFIATDLFSFSGKKANREALATAAGDRVAANPNVVYVHVLNSKLHIGTMSPERMAYHLATQDQEENS